LNNYNKVIAITNWEVPHLLELGCEKDRIVTIPNGFPEYFLNQKLGREENKILFLGRVAPIKDLETLILAFNKIKDKEIRIEIVGPTEKEYIEKLHALIKNLKLSERIYFSEPIYDLKEKIKKIDSAKIFVLPSKREGMPQALIEAMAREKIVISSKTDGGKEIVKDKENGHLFEIGNVSQLATVIDSINNSSRKTNEEMQAKAKASVEQFSWEILINKIEKEYSSLI
ncbi:MAG: glycosyltransferase family 4 protein, partial [archaeon]